jgi:hypothetical protein
VVVDMKGISLPINILVIIVIAVIVLIAVILMFYTPFNSGTGSVSLETAKSQACRSLVVAYNCNINTDLNQIKVDNYDVTGDNQMNTLPLDSLMQLCVTKFQIGATDTASCRRLCGCAA